MNESILNSIKHLLGIDAEDTHFDTDVIIHINSVLSVLTQLGVGSSLGFSISGATETWLDFFGTETARLNSVISYVYMKVRLLFDPPTSSALIDSMNRLIGEFEWRLNVTVDPGD